MNVGSGNLVGMNEPLFNELCWRPLPHLRAPALLHAPSAFRTPRICLLHSAAYHRQFGIRGKPPDCLFAIGGAAVSIILFAWQWRKACLSSISFWYVICGRRDDPWVTLFVSALP